MLSLKRTDGSVLKLSATLVHRAYFIYPENVLFGARGYFAQARGFYRRRNVYDAKGFGYFREKGLDFAMTVESLPNGGESWCVVERLTGSRMGDSHHTAQGAFTQFESGLPLTHNSKLYDKVREVYEGCQLGVQMRPIELITTEVLL